MFIQEGEYKIWISFDQEVSIRVEGPDDLYFVQWLEYMPNNEFPNLLYGVDVQNGEKISDPRRWYGKHRIDISRWDENEGIVLIHSHTYNDRDRDVFFRIDNQHLGATKEWLEEVYNYVEKSGCIPHISTNFNQDLSIKSPGSVEYYSSFYIGRYFQETHGDVEQSYGEIHYSLFRKYWSHHNPRNWEKIGHREVARDILGLTEWEDGILFTFDKVAERSPNKI